MVGLVGLLKQFCYNFFLPVTDHPILQTMDLRTWDKQAQDFVKKHKQRIATS